MESINISVAGCIVIARYGNSLRGIKANLAAENGAVGIILYSDPNEDGSTRGIAFFLSSFGAKSEFRWGEEDAEWV